MKSLLVKQENQGEAFSYEILWKEDFSGLGAEVKKLQLPAKKSLHRYRQYRCGTVSGAGETGTGTFV